VAAVVVAPLGEWATDGRLPHHQATKAGVGVAGESQAEMSMVCKVKEFFFF
jgi:hypothetical protein